MEFRDLSESNTAPLSLYTQASETGRKPLDFALKLGNSPVKVHHALLQILAEPADVQVLGRVGSVRFLELPLAQRPGQAVPRLGEGRPLAGILSPRALHQVVQFGPAVGWNLWPRTTGHVPNDLPSGQRGVGGAPWKWLRDC